MPDNEYPYAYGVRVRVEIPGARRMPADFTARVQAALNAEFGEESVTVSDPYGESRAEDSYPTIYSTIDIDGNYEYGPYFTDESPAEVLSHVWQDHEEAYAIRITHVTDSHWVLGDSQDYYRDGSQQAYIPALFR
jgi:hypothetical protein